MASIRFNPRDTKEPSKVRPILAIVTEKGKQILRYSTKISICLDDWNKVKQNVRKSNNDFQAHNAKLSKFQSTLKTLSASLELEGITITKEAVLKVFDLMTAKQRGKVIDNTLIGFFKREITKLPTKLNPTTLRPYDVSTLNKYSRAYDLLLELQEQEKIKFLFQNIDMDFYYKYINFLQGKNLRPNTIGVHHVRVLITILHEAERQGLVVNSAYKDRLFSVPSEKTEKVYLTTKEIERIEKLVFDDSNRHLEHSRDMFLLGCYTGQRHNEFSRFKKEHFESTDDGMVIKIVQSKGNKLTVIPIGSNVIAIMERYNWNLTKTVIEKGVIINQSENTAYTELLENAKEVCKLAGIDNAISVTQRKGSETKTVVRPKYELIGTHTGRRSFATNMYKSGKLQMLDIMQITGHSKVETFLGYICTTKEESANVIRNIQDGIKLEYLKAI